MRQVTRSIVVGVLSWMLIAGAGASSAANPDTVTAGFARVDITPPVGTPMTGFGSRDHDPIGSKGVHDRLYARALYLAHGGEEILIMGFDLCFFSREEADRYKGAIGRHLDLRPSQILLNTSHNHTGPRVHKWYYEPSEPMYLDDLELKIVRAGYEEIRTTTSNKIKAKWARDMISRLDRGYKLPTAVPITLHGIKLGDNLRLVALEGEATAPYAFQMEKAFDGGITFPLGFSNGCQLYLPTSEMLDQGGYEVVSYWEYRQPAPLAKGMEQILSTSLVRLFAE